MNSYLTFQLISSVFLWYQSPTTTPFFAIYIYSGSWAWRGAPPRHAPNVIIYIYIYNNQIFFVQSVVSRGRNQRRGHNKRRFGLSCVRIVYFLRKSLDFHFMRTHCQIIIYKLLLPIYNKSPSIAKHRPLTIFLLPVFTHSLIAPRYLPNHSPVKSCFSLPSIFLILLSGWRCRPVFLYLDCRSCDVKLLPCIRGCKLEHSFKYSLS